MFKLRTELLCRTEPLTQISLVLASVHCLHTEVACLPVSVSCALSYCYVVSMWPDNKRPRKYSYPSPSPFHSLVVYSNSLLPSSPMGKCIVNLYLSDHFSAELGVNITSQNLSSQKTLAVNMSAIKPLISSLFRQETLPTTTNMETVPLWTPSLSYLMSYILIWVVFIRPPLASSRWSYMNSNLSLGTAMVELMLFEIFVLYPCSSLVMTLVMRDGTFLPQNIGEWWFRICFVWGNASGCFLGLLRLKFENMVPQVSSSHLISPESRLITPWAHFHFWYPLHI